MTDHVNVTRVVRKQSLHASVIRACKQCGAPGYWHDIPGVNPGCYAPEKVTKLGEDPVGEVCPQCGEEREPVEYKGEIWSREWRVGLWTVLVATVRDWFKPIWSTLQWRVK
jgi:hypothetical protein